MWKYLLESLQFHEQKKFLPALIFPWYYFQAIKFIVIIPWKKVIFQVIQTKILFPQMGRLLYIRMNHFDLFVILYRLQEGWKSLWWYFSDSTIVPVNAALSSLFSIPVLFHSYSLLNIAVAHQTLTELHQPCSSNSIAVAHQTLTELHLTVHQPCSSNSKPMQDGTHKHQTVLLASMLPGCRNSQMCQNFVHVWL